jgi:hypothetical protein
MTTQYHTINLVVTLVVRATLSHYRTASAISQEMTIPLFLIHNVIHWPTAGHPWDPMHQFAHLIEKGKESQEPGTVEGERGTGSLYTEAFSGLQMFLNHCTWRVGFEFSGVTAKQLASAGCWGPLGVIPVYYACDCHWVSVSACVHWRGFSEEGLSIFWLCILFLQVSSLCWYSTLEAFADHMGDTESEVTPEG